MTTATAPTCKQLFNEELPLADRKTDDSWRHGVRVTEVYRRDEDGTFWQAKYRLSTDGETNELRDGDAQIVQVFPREINVTVYESK
jgi:hypothetical protein